MLAQALVLWEYKRCRGGRLASGPPAPLSPARRRPGRREQRVWVQTAVMRGDPPRYGRHRRRRRSAPAPQAPGRARGGRRAGSVVLVPPLQQRLDLILLQVVLAHDLQGGRGWVRSAVQRAWPPTPSHPPTRAHTKSAPLPSAPPAAPSAAPRARPFPPLQTPPGSGRRGPAGCQGAVSGVGGSMHALLAAAAAPPMPSPILAFFSRFFRTFSSSCENGRGSLATCTGPAGDASADVRTVQQCAA